MTDDRNHQITQEILSVSRSRWLKTAMVIAMSKERCDEKGIAVELDEIAGVINALCESGRLESQGNLANWRRSEVRLPKLRYWHVVDYDEQARKFVITRVFESGESHVHEEYPVGDAELGCWLGAALINDTPALRDEI